MLHCQPQYRHHALEPGGAVFTTVSDNEPISRIIFLPDKCRQMLKAMLHCMNPPSSGWPAEALPSPCIYYPVKLMRS